MKDWSRADCAFVEKRRRGEWLELLNASEVRTSKRSFNLQGTQQLLFWKWCTTRKLNVSSIHLNGRTQRLMIEPFVHTIFAEFVETCGTRTTQLIVDDFQSKIKAYLSTMTEHCTNIRSMELRQCKDLSGLGALLRCCAATLERLHITGDAELEYNAFVGLSLPCLLELRVAELTRSRLICAFASLVVGCPSLTEVQLTACSGREAIESIISALHQYGQSLRALSFIRCAGLSEENLSLVGQTCPQLESFTIHTSRSAPRALDQGVDALTANCAHLHTLQISEYYTGMSDVALQHIARNCGTNLLHLSVRGLDCNFSDVGTLALARSCTHLRALCWEPKNNSEEATSALLRSLPQLRELECAALSLAALQCAIDHCPLLWHLHAQLPTAAVQYVLELKHGAALRELVLKPGPDACTALVAVALPVKVKRPDVRITGSLHGTLLVCPSLR